MEQMQKTYAQLVFIHQALTQKGQYFVDEFEIAKDAIVMITSLCNELKAKIDKESQDGTIEA